MAEMQPNKPAGIVTTVESPESWQRVVKVEMARQVYDSEYAGRLKKAVKGHQKQGFRKGRTPRSVVEKEVGDLLRAETIEALIPKAWTTAVLEHKLVPLNDPSLENFEFGDEGPLTFDLKVEVKPEVTVGDCDGFPVKRRLVEVADKDVDEVVERLRESRAEFQVVDRAAAEGDRLKVDLVPGEDAQGMGDGGTIADQELVLGAESNMPAFNEGLAAARAGDERDIDVVYPDEHPNEELKGRTLTFGCKVKEVAAKILPEVDDAFAAAVEEGKTVLELRTDIRRDLQRELERQVASEMDQQALLELVARNEVSVPPSMVDRYLDSGLEELHRRSAQTGQPTSPEQDAQYRETGRPHAEQALQGMLLMEAVRRQEKIKVEASDVDDKIAEIAAEHGFEVEKYREFVNSGDQRERLEFDLLERRAYDFLLSRAEISDVPADTDVLAEKE
ncbi:trigger factor [bacterium]|nr:MAG: trigger factor [bacterium]